MNTIELHKNKKLMAAPVHLAGTLLRSAFAAVCAGGICFAVIHFLNLNILVKSILGMILALSFYIIPILPEIKLLKRF